MSFMASLNIASTSEQAAQKASLLRGIADTDYASSALEQQVALVGELEKDVRKSEQALRAAQAKVKVINSKDKENGGLSKVVHKITGQGDKYMERAKKAEQEHKEAAEGEWEAKQHLEEVKAKLEAAQKEKTELEGIKNRNLRYMKQLDELYSLVLAGRSIDPKKEAAMAQAQSAYEGAHSRYTRGLETVAILQEADTKLQEAVKEVDTLSDVVNLDVLQMTSQREFMNTLPERNNGFAKVKTLVSEVDELLSRSGVQLPPEADALKVDPVDKTFLGSIYSFPEYHRKMTVYGGELAKMGLWLTDEIKRTNLRWVESGQERNRAESMLDVARKELIQVRTGEFDRFVGLSGGEDEGLPPAYR